VLTVGVLASLSCERHRSLSIDICIRVSRIKVVKHPFRQITTLYNAQQAV